MKSPFLTRREEIILSTIALIHEVGITKVSIKEIAKRENVTEASLYKHFKSKEEILLCVIDYYMKYDSHIHMTVEECGLSAKEKILTYFKLYAEYYENYKEITALLMAYEVLLYEDNLSGRIKDIIQENNRFLVRLVEDGIEKKEFNSGEIPDNVSAVLSGVFKEIISRWRLEDFSFRLKDRVLETMTELFKRYEKDG